jgi:hypothetical protein
MEGPCYSGGRVPEDTEKTFTVLVNVFSVYCISKKVMDRYSTLRMLYV